MHDAGTRSPTHRSASAGTQSRSDRRPSVLRVSGGRAIQRAIEAARPDAGNGSNARPKLVVIYPNTAANYAPHNPYAAYFENVVLHGKVMLQGVGPGGAIDPTQPRGTARTSTPRSSGRPRKWFLREATRTRPTAATPTTGVPSPAALPRAGSGPADIPEGEGILALAESQGAVRRHQRPHGAVPARRRRSAADRWRSAGQPRQHQHHPGRQWRHHPWRDQPWSGTGRRDHGRSVRA